MDNLHYCTLPGDADAYERHRDWSYKDLPNRPEFDMGIYGMAIIFCFEVPSGYLFVTNGEYSNKVNYCPWCGYEAKRKIE